MHLDLQNINQAQLWLNRSTSLPMYQFEKQQESVALKAIGPLIGLVDTAFQAIESIATIAEGIFKGFLNMLGSWCFASCNFSRGFWQIAGVAATALVALPTLTARFIYVSYQCTNNPCAFFRLEVIRLERESGLAQASTPSQDQQRPIIESPQQAKRALPRDTTGADEEHPVRRSPSYDSTVSAGSGNSFGEI